MFVVLSATNRPGCNTLKVARRVESAVIGAGREAQLITLHDLPQEVFSPESYAVKPPSFAPFQEAFDACAGVITVIPEYNGSFPGVLKYFVDMLKFPETLADVPCAFVGLSAGRWGGVRAVEHMEQVFLYRHAQIYGRRVFLPGIMGVLDGEGRITDEALAGRLDGLVQGFVAFADRVRPK